jgi:hypothetical protein
MTGVVVYPYIAPNFEWLKTAALLWDKVHRISSEFSPADPVEVGELDAAVGGLLRSHEVEPKMSMIADPLFGAWLKSHYEDLDARGFLSVSADWMTIYPDKLADGLVKLLWDYGLARDADRPEWHDVTLDHLIGKARH